MNYSSVSLRKPLALLGVGLSLFAAQAAFAQSPAPVDVKKDDTLKLDKFVVTGSFIPSATSEPVGPIAIFTENEIRASGAATTIQALRYLPSFVGNAGTTENDSNGGSGATAVSLRGLGAGQTLILIDGRVTGNFSNIQLIPIEAVESIEVLRDGAGIIYGSGAIGGAVNIKLKKSYTGSKLNLYVGGATRSPGARETVQASFVAGAASGGTSLLVSGSYFKNRTIFASQRPNSAQSDLRLEGGLNGGSPTFPGHIAIGGGGTPRELRRDFPATGSTPTLADYGPYDTNGFSSNQLFNFRQFSPSAPGQIRNSLLVNFDQAMLDNNRLSLFSSFLYSRLQTSNGLAPAPFGLSAIGADGGPAVGSLSRFGPYNNPTNVAGQNILNEDDNDFFRYRSVEIGNRTNRQTYTDYRMQVGLKGDLTDKWHWEAAMSLENEEYEQVDAGVPSLPLLDAEVAAGRFNPFVPAFSTGTAVIGGQTFTWDNAKALQAASIHAKQQSPTKTRFFDARVNGTIMELPAGDLGFAAGWEKYSSDSVFDPDPLYASGSVLGLNSFTGSFSGNKSKSIFAEIKVPIISEKNKISFVHELTLGALARRESQTNTGLNPATNAPDSRTYKKTNPSVNLHYSPTKDYLFRATYSKGFITPSSGAVFGTSGTNNPTLADPLGFPTTAQTTIIVRTNPDLGVVLSKAVSFGFVGTPKDFIKGLSFSVDYYKITVSGIVASNFASILALNAAGQGAGFVPGNAATINPNAPFAALIKRTANGQLNGRGNFGALGGGNRGAVLSDYTNIASRDVTGLEYAVTYSQSTQDWGRFKWTAAANQFLKFDQSLGAGVPVESFVGKFVSTVGNPISPGSIPRWKGNFSTQWSYKNFSANAVMNYIAAYKDDPLFVLSPGLKAFYDAGTGTTANPAFVAFLAAGAKVNPRVGGDHTINAFTTFDLRLSYDFKGDNLWTKGISVSLGSTNLLDKLAPRAFGGFNDGYDTRTHNNIGRFVYLDMSKQF